MKLATLKTKERDGQLLVIDKELKQAVKVEFVPHFQAALDDWATVATRLQEISKILNAGKLKDAFPVDLQTLAAPLPRAYQWLDGSVYLSHVERVRKSRGVAMPVDATTNPLMYQGSSDTMLGACDPIMVRDEGWGIDCEGEVGVIVDDVPMGVTSEQAIQHIQLIVLINDISLRNLAKAELEKGFGFLQCKPPTAFSPVAITPDELGEAWQDGRIHLPLRVSINNKLLGEPNAGVGMQFNFPTLIAHAAKTRPLGAGTIIGSGTVSNHDESKGVACLVEKRTLEIIATGEAKTPFLKFGDEVTLEMRDKTGNNIFGTIQQTVEKA